jgi:acyl carrier protein
MNIRSEIITQFKLVAEEQGMQLAPLTDDLALLDSGLDSLCFAMIVAKLEMQLGIDPFSTSEDVVFPVTFGGLVHFYEDAAK